MSEITGMHLRQMSESGSYARFFLELIAMYIIVAVIAFCLIAAAYASESAPTHGGAVISMTTT